MLKNVLKILEFTLLGFIIYLISSIFGTINIFPYFIILAIILSIIFIYKKSKKYLIISLTIYLIILLVAFFPFGSCDSYGKNTKYTSCDCNGIIKKDAIYNTQCIGKRTTCYRYEENLEITEEYSIKNNLTNREISDLLYEKIEVECK